MSSTKRFNFFSRRALRATPLVEQALLRLRTELDRADELDEIPADTLVVLYDVKRLLEQAVDTTFGRQEVR